MNHTVPPGCNSLCLLPPQRCAHAEGLPFNTTKLMHALPLLLSLEHHFFSITRHYTPWPKDPGQG
eukprot:50129-Chlamydomonas_euryale.AAC.1